MPVRSLWRALLLCPLALAACSSPETGSADAGSGSDAGSPPDAGSPNDAGRDAGGADAGGFDAGPLDAGPAPSGVEVLFALDELADAGFFAFPWPSDLRRTSDGGVDYTGFPNPKNSGLVTGLLGAARTRSGFAAMPTAYFAFDGGLSTTSAQGQVLPAQASQPIQLIDVDPGSPQRGQLYPVTAAVLPTDIYTPTNVLAVSPPPGIVLHGRRHYAFVVLRALNDATGAPLGVPAALWALDTGQDAGAPYGVQAQALYASLVSALASNGVAPTEVAAATVFTTDDVVADSSATSNGVLARDSAVLHGFALPSDGGAVYQGFCRVNGEVDYPKYQTGTPPFDFLGGQFVVGTDGLPVVQGTYSNVPVVLTFPQGEMPAAGYPLVAYWHGSGGTSDQAVNRGTAVQDGGAWVETPGQGPAWVLAPYGFATVCAALPLNPERVPGASDIEYLNLTNLAAFPDTFRQGVLEQRELLAALSGFQLSLTAGDLATCGITLPPGQTALHYDTAHVYGQGQSMGGMYANLITPVEPLIQATVASGAGGDWQSFVLTSPQVPNGTLALLLSTGSGVTWQHPTLMLLEAAWEPAEPMIAAARFSRDPLPGIPARSAYEPVGAADSFFPEATYDGMALAYGNEEAGNVVWSTMQTALALEGLSGLAPYPVEDDLLSGNGSHTTGVVAQYVDPTGYDGHYIFTQVDAVKHQYACFLSRALDGGTAVVVGPGALGSPCQ